MIYLYKNPLTGEIKEVIQSADSEHTYSEGDIKFEREFTIPNMSVDTRIDCQSSKDFSEKTGKKKGSLAQIIEKSAELSQERADKAGGVDPIKSKYYEDYSKKRGGAVHKDILKKQTLQKLDKLGVTVTEK